MHVFDTNICIDFLRGKLPHAFNLMQQADPEQFGIPAIVEAELRLGAEKSSDPTNSTFALEQLIRPFKVLPFDSLCALSYSHIRAELEAIGKPLGPADFFIAATAMAHQATLVTNDRAFARVPGLKVEHWAEVEFQL